MFGLVTRSEFDEAMKQSEIARSFLRDCIDRLADQVLAQPQPQPQPPQPPAPTLRKYTVKLKGGKTQTVIAAYDDIWDDGSLDLHTRKDKDGRTFPVAFLPADQWVSFTAEDLPEAE